MGKILKIKIVPMWFAGTGVWECDGGQNSQIMQVVYQPLWTKQVKATKDHQKVVHQNPITLQVTHITQTGILTTLETTVYLPTVLSLVLRFV